METATKEPTLIELEQQALEVRGGLSIEITDQGSYDQAIALRTEAGTWLKRTREFFKSMKDPAYAAWKKICSNENLVCDPVEQRLKQINAALVGFDQQQERLRREEQARLDAEARRKAEDERLRLAEEMRLEGADYEDIDQVLEAPVIVTEIERAAPTYEKSKAVVYRDNWSGECSDLLALIKYVAKNPQFRNLLQPNTPAINAQARALKETMQIPGIKVSNNKVVATGRG